MLGALDTVQRWRETLQSDLEPIRPYLDDEDVMEVLRNPDGTVWVDRIAEGFVRAPVSMSDSQAESLLRVVAGGTDRKLGRSEPDLRAEMPYPLEGADSGGGSGRLFRVQGVLPPWVRSATFAIRKPGIRILTFDDYLRQGVLTGRQVDLIKRAIWARETILIGGKGGCGKTTLAAAILEEIGQTGDRVYVMEDTRELRCTAANQVSVCIPKHEFPRAVEVAQRLHVDRIVVGEVLNSAALDMINAWITAPGGLGTLHAKSLSGVLERVCQLIPSASCPPRQVIADCIDLLIHVTRDADAPGGRRVLLARPAGVNPDSTFRVAPLE